VALILVAAVLALAVTAFLNAAELAVFSLAESRIRTLVDERFRGSESLAQLREDPAPVAALLRTCRAGSVAVVAGAAVAFGSRFGTGGVLAAIVVAAAALLVLGDVVPSRLAAKHNVRFALDSAPVLLTAARLLRPLLALTREAPYAMLSRSGGAGADEHEVIQISTLGESEGVIEEHERELVERALRLDESKAWDVMTPRVDIFAWPGDRTLDSVAPEFATVRYSRVPVYDETIDDITGVLYMRDAYQALMAGKGEMKLSELAREPLLVPGSISLTRLLQEFQTRRIHMALVVDEYGGTDGLVTLEDVLEELVGEIEDETDIAVQPIIRISRDEIEAAGDVDVRRINAILRVNLALAEHRSLNGYLLEEIGRVPQAGEQIERDGVLIEVLEATETQVLRARVRRGREPGTPHSPDRGGSPSHQSESGTGIAAPGDGHGANRSSSQSPATAGADRSGTDQE